MKIWIETSYRRKELEKSVKLSGIKIDKHRPDFVITYGGDGTILRAEQRYPGVPKIPIRKSHNCNMCVDSIEGVEVLIRKLLKKQYRIKEFEKVEAIFGGKRFLGLNEIQVHNKDPRKALRFTVSCLKAKKPLIGDGVIVSTAYGSTGYYSALGYKPFKSGVMVGLNNVNNIRRPIKTDHIEIKVIRETGLLLADNQKTFAEVKPGQTVKIGKSKEKARFVQFL